MEIIRSSEGRMPSIESSPRMISRFREILTSTSLTGGGGGRWVWVGGSWSIFSITTRSGKHPIDLDVHTYIQHMIIHVDLVIGSALAR